MIKFKKPVLQFSNWGTGFSMSEQLHAKGAGEMEQWMNLIQEIGFPIFVSFYLLHRIETKLVAIHDVLVTLKTE
ncbi:hypothetical protein AU377_05440 [Sporosarcina sp. HYO08]|nr:hypothetical protein AU377_05440 [Sporosarcina sp. HYO08]